MFRTLHGITSIKGSGRYRVTDARATVCGYIETYCPQRVLACDADGRVIVFARSLSEALEAVIAASQSATGDAGTVAAS